MPQARRAPESAPIPKHAARRLLAWYDASARELPWRERGGAPPDPYRVWLSEIMLQQTRVAAVVPYFAEFIRRWPTVEALAAAPLDEVLAAWAGLGYYARARNLHACARRVAGELGGKFPATEEGLCALPGIGPYTAAAIAAIAFGARAAAVDGNVLRVIARLFAVEEPLPAAKPRLAALAKALTPATRPGDYAQAIMDLGATLCAPRDPDCGACPWRGICAARARGIAARLPVRAAKRTRPIRRGIAFWAQRGDGAVLLRRRPDSGLLGGMMEIPSTPWRAEPWELDEALDAAPLASRWRLLPGTVGHDFTHFRLELAVAAGRAREARKVPGEWCALDELSARALPTLMRKVTRHALASLA